ncbi:hypothetical protein [Clostridium sp. YIM B02551]|uniref:hypothetical protein n=1 Tax=Clostridium sp. YIM B02551 TaxID=2910679 RepID=UPI001EEBD543|nr:hypothetical protein [Clostridium sp. YIM B02551]
MNKKKFIILAVCIVFISIIFYMISKKTIATPDKIIVHDNGKLTEVSKDSSEFNEIVKLTKGRFNFNMYITKDYIDDSTIEYIRQGGVGIEFIYNDEQKCYINILLLQSIKYNKLYFQLEDKKNDTSKYSVVNTFQYSDKYHYKDSSRGPLKYSKELVDLVNKIKDK